MSSVADEFVLLIQSAAKELGKSVNASRVRALAENKMVQLAAAVGQPGYDQALIAARNTVAMELGLEAVSVADAADAQLRGVIMGALSMGARLLLP